jgi:hypothetical protein
MGAKPDANNRSSRIQTNNNLSFSTFNFVFSYSIDKVSRNQIIYPQDSQRIKTYITKQNCGINILCMGKKTSRKITIATNGFNHVIITLLGFGTKSHDYAVLTKNKMKDVMDIAILDRSILQELTADKFDDKGNIIKSNAPMNIFTQKSVIIMSNMQEHNI